jgi:hypothetical protein
MKTFKQWLQMRGWISSHLNKTKTRVVTNPKIKDCRQVV